MRLNIAGIFMVVASTLLGPGCSSTGKNGDLDASIVNIPSSSNGGHPDTKSLAIINFKALTHDFGKIRAGEKVFWSFEFTNTGMGDLLILEAHGSCGCTVPNYPKNPIPKQATSKIDVTFDSEGKQGIVEKTVTVVSNTSPNTTILKIKAEIQPNPDKTN